MQKTEFLALMDELFEVDPGTVADDTVLKDVPSWSSLTFVGLIAVIDEEYGVSMPPNAILNCQTAGDLAAQVAARLPQRAAA